MLLLLGLSCSRPVEFPAGSVLKCDAENKNAKGNQFIAANDSNSFFAGGHTQSSNDYFSGHFSVLTVPKKSAFSMAHEVHDIGPNWTFKVSVWRKSKDGKGTLVAASSKPDYFYLATSDPIETKANGWQKLELDVFTPPYFNKDVLKFYVWNNGTDSVYFDDLVIQRLKKPEYPVFNEPPLVLVVDSSDIIKIMDKREEAFASGILQTSDDDWIKGFLFGEDKMMKAKIRLKGDWLDHLWSNKWSYRIKMRKNNAWNRLRTFSVQSPEARNYLLEWVAHQLYQSKDVLTTRYGFVPLLLNNESRGLYAWEEHFVKQLLEWRNRREGPILKFSEDAFWQIQKMNIKFKTWPHFPYYEAATIQPFGESRTLENPALYQQFIQGQKLLMQYKQGTQPPAAIFDLDKLATYFAMLDLTHARHGMAWHNQRFYFNPVIQKLEPIAFDGYTNHEEIDLSIKDNLAFVTNNLTEIKDDNQLFVGVFTDSLFLVTYLKKLYEVSDPVYIDQVLTEIYPQQCLYDSLLKLEFAHYSFDAQMIRNSAASIRNYLPELTSYLQPWITHESLPIKEVEQLYSDTAVFENTPEYFVNAYVESKGADSMWLEVYNYFPRKIILLGTSSKDKYITHYFSQEPHVEALHSSKVISSLDLKVDTSAQYLFFMLENRFNTYRVPINQWPFPNGLTPQQELFLQANIENNPYFDLINGHDLVFKTDSLVIEEPLIIPPGYRVVIETGTVLNLINEAMFISYSPIFMHGTSQQPIVVTSSDFSGNGFTVLQAVGRSSLKFVQFNNLNTLQYKGWTLTGAVSFYESDVDFEQVSFYRNKCEDALNVIRSDFSLSDCQFEYVFSDAFDSDFSTGEVVQCTFNNIGNDAIDFSGSTILIKDSQIVNANDKGISGGEDSHLEVVNVLIKKSNIGIASKDLSSVRVSNTEIQDCNYGLVLLQKKPEYGPSSMELLNTNIVNAKEKYLVEKGSVILWDGVTIEGELTQVGALFY